MATHDYLRYGANEIRGYVDDELSFEINAQGFSQLVPDATVSLAFASAAWAANPTAVVAKIYRVGNQRIIDIPVVAAGSSNPAAPAETCTAAIKLDAKDWPSEVAYLPVPGFAFDGVANVGTGMVFRIGNGDGEVTMGSVASITAAAQGVTLGSDNAAEVVGTVSRCIGRYAVSDATHMSNLVQ